MNCPICNKQCNEEKEEIYPNHPSYQCPTDIQSGDKTRSHYIKYVTGVWTTGGYYLESAFVDQYRVEIHHLGGRIMKRTDKLGVVEERKLDTYATIGKLEEFPTDSALDELIKYRFKTVLRLPPFELCNEKDLLDKIKTYLIFS